MKKSTISRGLALMSTVAIALGLAACGGDSGETTTDNGAAETSEEAPAGESEEFVADLNDAVTIINDQIAVVDGAMQQIMLASDVDQPTQKYGMWVMPFYPSEATEKFISTIQITDGTDFVVTLTSAATGAEWTMDQSGTMAEVASE